MDNKYKVFSEQYNGLLSLIEQVDESLACNYKRVIDSLPQIVLNKLESKVQFCCDGRNFRAILDKYEDQICFDYTTYDKYLCTSIVLQPFYEDELIDSEELDRPMMIDQSGLFLFALSYINTEDEPTIKLKYKQENDTYEFVDADINGVEINTEVFLKCEDGQFYLTSKQTFIDEQLVVYEKKVPVKYSDLIESINSEDETDYLDELEM